MAQPPGRHVKGLVTGIGSSGQPCVDDQLVVPQEKNPPGNDSDISHQSGKQENFPPKTDIAPENGPSQKGKWSSNHQFSGAMLF